MADTREPAAEAASSLRPIRPADRSRFDESPTRTAARWALVLVAMVMFVGLADALGATWLRGSVIGIPVGVWFAGLLTPGMVWFAGHHRRVVRVDLLARGARSLWPEQWPTGLITPAWDAIGKRGRRVEDLLDEYTEWTDRAIAWHDRAAWPTRPIRIAVAGPDWFVDALRDAPSSASRPVEWSTFDSEIDPDTLAHERGLDAAVAVRQGRVTVCCPEHDDRDASWFDWSLPRPLSYASVYPLRVDTARFELPEMPREGETRLVRDLIEAMAVLSRSPWRLTLGDRINGRRPFGASRARHEREVMRSLGEFVRRVSATDEPSRAHQIAARVVSAWAIGAEGDIPESERTALLEAAANALPGEPDATLRLAAARFAGGDDDTGIELLLKADADLRAEGATERFGLGLVAGSSDHAAIVQAEFEHGGDDDATLGRVAGGVCLLAAATPDERLPFLRDDLVDEFRYAGWLIGREADEVLLRRILIALEESRTGEPKAKHAEKELSFPRRAA